jgi:Putative Ig domain
MGKLGWSLIVWATALLAGCGGTGSTSTANSNEPCNLAVTTTSLPGGTVGAAYGSAVAASGGSTPYTYSAGNLPSGLSINSGTETITGTPAQKSAGTWSATVKVTDSTHPSSQSAHCQAKHEDQRAAAVAACSHDQFLTWRRGRVALSLDCAPGLRRCLPLYVVTGLWYVARRIEPGSRRSHLRNAKCSRALSVDLRRDGFLFHASDCQGRAHPHNFG